jgi:hypothetical protein
MTLRPRCSWLTDADRFHRATVMLRCTSQAVPSPGPLRERLRHRLIRDCLGDHAIAFRTTPAAGKGQE